jgi:hypothetical protein
MLLLLLQCSISFHALSKSALFHSTFSPMATSLRCSDSAKFFHFLLQCLILICVCLLLWAFSYNAYFHSEHSPNALMKIRRHRKKMTLSKSCHAGHHQIVLRGQITLITMYNVYTKKNHYRLICSYC